MLGKSFIYATMALNLTLSATVFAGGHGQGHRMAEMAAQYDTNGDGMVTVAEIQAGRVAEFQLNDSNADAGLSVEELQTLMQTKRDERMNARLTALDTDANGSLSVAEFQAGAPANQVSSAATLFGLADTNNDAALDAAEMAVLKSPEGRVWRQFARLDTDGNGVISETEYSTSSMGGRMGGHRRGFGSRF